MEPVQKIMCFIAIGLTVMNLCLLILVPVYCDRLDLREGVIRCLQHKRGDEGGGGGAGVEDTRNWYWYRVAL